MKARLFPVPRLLTLLLLAGFAQMVIQALTTGDGFDLESYRLADVALRESHFHAYGALEVGGVPRWPYPPGFFPVILVLTKIAYQGNGTPDGLIRLAGAVGTLGIAWVVALALYHRGQSARQVLGAAALIALGPCFIAVALHGQLDTIAFFPAVAAVALWEARPDDPRRAIWCGLLIGIAASIKTVPIVLVLALLPHVRDRRELLTLLASAAVIPVVITLPFLLAEPDATLGILRYRGAPGVGGLSLLMQPDLAHNWLNGTRTPNSDLTDTLQGLTGVILGAGLLAVGALLLRHRPLPHVGALLIVLAMWALGFNFFLQYAVWGLPFLLLAGWFRAALLMQAVFLVPLAFRYGPTIAKQPPFSSDLVSAVYVPVMIALWVASVAGLAWLVRRVAENPPALPAWLATSRA